MITNFDYLKEEARFSAFADVAVSAEKIVLLDPEACIMNCRRAMEFAIKWMYSVDDALEKPYQDNLQSLMSEEEFRQIVGKDLLKRMEYIRKTGNNAAHAGKKLGRDEAFLCLENLFIFLDFIAYCYSDNYTERSFDEGIINARIERAKKSGKSKTENESVKAELEKKQAEIEKTQLDLQKLIDENARLKDEFSAKRADQQPGYVQKPLDFSEYKTRRLYIDSMLMDAGWTLNKDWFNEFELSGMPNQSGTGYADYVLFDDSHRPLAVIEAKRTCADVAVGRQQAKLYADILEQKYKRRPVIFLTNGFETRIIDGQYPERKCSVIYSKRDLEKLFNLRTMRTGLKNVSVDKNIAGRYYQESAIKAVCDSFDSKNRRKALLVMATGSGKTRTVIALCDILLNAGWVKNILFLADRTSLVVQAKRNFVNLMPNLSCTNISEEKDNYNAHCVFSTYQTMIRCVDTVKDDDGKIFSSGHFDLIICDEAHRSIYNKYRDIFDYFDAPLVGLTATPKDEIDKNTYEVFELENGVPTYGYDLAQAVKDGYLVDYLSVETKLKFIENGIVYDELSETDKEQYEKTFAYDDNIPESISSSALNTWIFNEDTIKQVLHTVMDNGIKIDYGQKIGKTIIFAKNHNHANKILEIFNKEYPHLNGFATVVDNQTKYAQSVIDEFSNPKKLPQIVISVDMLDTGIDVPEVLNLVFFKKVMSKAKFWQMIGRGTRLCTGLIDGADKDKFYIFDFCGNFEFFRLNKGKASANSLALQGALFGLKFDIAYKLQSIEYQTEMLKDLRKRLVAELIEKVRALPKPEDSFAVRQHLKYVELYSVENSYQAINFEDTLIIREELAPLILPDSENVDALRFDALIYALELAELAGKPYRRGKTDLRKRVEGIASVANIPEIQAQSELINNILNTDLIERADIGDFEHIRECLRNLMKFIEKNPGYIYITNFDDEILSLDWNESELENDDLKNYKAKAEFYIRQHQDNISIAKLKMNKPLNDGDMENLERILWSEVGSKDDYEQEIGSIPLGEFVRSIVGLDMNAAKEAFSEYLSDTSLDSRQIYFVNQIVEYIIHNGMLKDRGVLRETPFTDRGSIVEIFESRMDVFEGIMNTINEINANAA